MGFQRIHISLDDCENISHDLVLGNETIICAASCYVRPEYFKKYIHSRFFTY